MPTARSAPTTSSSELEHFLAETREAVRAELDRLGLTEIFAGIGGKPARSFPVNAPVFRLDRIYVRGFSVESAQVHFGSPRFYWIWGPISSVV